MARKIAEAEREVPGNTPATTCARPTRIAVVHAIAEAIDLGEQTHRGEVRLIVEKALPFEAAWEGVTNRQRAIALFADYGVVAGERVRPPQQLREVGAVLRPAGDARAEGQPHRFRAMLAQKA